MKNISTKEKILQTALELFNNKGIEYVGMRELAAELNLRIGNLTYYFPTKDDLVFEISRGLAELNSQTIIEDERISMKSFLEMLKKVFYNHAQYNCLMLSFVHLIHRNPKIAERYKNTENNRKNTWYNNLGYLQNNGYISLESEDEKAFLVSSIAFIARFWISEASVSYRHLNTNEQIEHYLQLLIRILLPFATEKGRAELQEMIKENS